VVAVAAVVTLSGCGGTDSGSADPSTSSTPTPSSTHQSEPGEPDLVSVPGYEFTAAPADGQEAIDSMLTVLEGVYTGGSIHMVTTPDGTEIGGLMLFSVSPEATDLGVGNADSLLGSYAGAAGAEGTVETIAGETVVTGPADSDGAKTYVWFHEGVLTMYVGDEAESADFMEAYLAAHA
jgi:hypothetical protein